jgi:phospholipid/cholesterol/gamma-HCH transport system substrate-binding protein
VAAICALIAAVTLVVALLLLSRDGGHHYKLLFQTAGQLVKGNQVQIGGVPVGSIDRISLANDSLAEVDISLEQQLHEGTTATIRATGLAGIANHYVSISPGPDNLPALPDGATLGLTSTTTPVDLDQVLNAFKPEVRRGLSRFIQGNAAVYEGKGLQANRTYEYLAPALTQSKLVAQQLTADKRLFSQFVINSSKLVTAISQRAGDLSSSISNARLTFDAIARHTDSLDRAVRALPVTFRQANTTFVNLRAALDDVDPLVRTAKPATKHLAPFLGRLRPVLKRAVPVVHQLSLITDRPEPANDAKYLLGDLPKLRGRAANAFPAAVGAIHAFQPILDFARPYSPDILQSLTKLGQITGYYDANGHYARAEAAGLNLFSYDSASHLLDPIPVADQFDPFGPPKLLQRCPGAATQSAPDLSNPFVDPPWAESGLDSTDCRPSDLPPGP